MKQIVALLIVAFSLLPLGLATGQNLEPPPPNPEEIDRVEGAIEATVAGQREYVLAFLVGSVSIEDTRLSRDRQWAVSLLIPYNPETGQYVESEPGLAIARLIEDNWQVWTPVSEGWIEMVKAAPLELLSPAHKANWVNLYETAEARLPETALSGYLLPWEAGIARYLTGSTCHDGYIPSGNAHYAFDFALNRTMWDIYAVKGGIVWVWDDSVKTCYDYSCWQTQPVGNYLVIKDESTEPDTYHLYLHLKQDSIPPELKVRGAPVKQGQFIAVVDNTGQSSGSHLHFQVQVPYLGEDHYWGRSVDITFDDVTINGGRPRINDPLYCRDDLFCTWEGDVCEQYQLYYTSGNIPLKDLTAPVGDLLDPLNGVSIDTDTLPLEGWASDDGSGIASAQFQARYDGSWHDVGPVMTSTLFSFDWDWCAAGVPDGPVGLALEISDKAGNLAAPLTGLRTIFKHHDCNPPPLPPACQPTSNQVALFSDPDYQGACTLLAAGDYASATSFPTVGNDNAESILVGANVMATLFSGSTYSGRGETVTASDANLAENRLGANTLSSLKVMARTATPLVPIRVWPANGAAFEDSDSIDLVWNDAGGGAQFQIKVNGTAKDPTTLPYWSLGSLAPGDYTWQVRAIGPTSQSAYSAQFTFTVSADSTPPPATLAAPFNDDLEGGDLGWSASGFWNLRDDANTSHSATHSWWYGQTATGNYNNSSPNFGDLTSPPITLTSSSDPYLLQFWSRTQTESRYPHWDQRRVQISVDGGPFEDIYQLYDDAADWWTQITLDLSPYFNSSAEHTIQVRFHFHTLDALANTFAGWYLDDIQVSATPLLTCTDPIDSNNDPASAQTITYGQTLSKELCPGGDYDYYKFNGTAGDRLVADVDAQSIGSTLDPVLTLLDNDGSSALFEADDEVLYTLIDPLLGYLLPRTGSYYLRLRAWDHPMGKGEYDLSLFTDSNDPTLAITWPADSGFLPQEVFTITAQASDSTSGISHVQFFWHSGDWQASDWVAIGEDRDSTDGWQIAYDATTEADQSGLAIYAVAYDWAGNWTAAGAWNLAIDSTPPDANFEPLTTPDSTALHLRWNASDALSGIASFDLRSRIDSETTWQTTSDLPASSRDWWYVGEPGHKYTFQIQVWDNAGNREDFKAAGNETSAAIPAASQLCSAPDSWDVSASDNDNAYASATPITENETGLNHNFCNPAAGDWLADEDWFSFQAIAGQRYVITFFPQTESAAANIQLFDSDGDTQLAEEAQDQFGSFTHLEWTAPADQIAYLRFSHFNPAVAGNGVVYQVYLTQVPPVFLPLIYR